ncbi:MAG: glycoside hydrolase family 9 protein [Proteiniphilum sp.]|uniref:glycoside hydrolase family 9 protein n=1 Tax=Proteiniphilum sp. TaxID=1926877 RepID=UPI002B1F7978|nr:glycoside hydrolase family 9 protein [Proteiniphilum sp.]MEA5129999.1 glycoside hydrolase family 9 protein [Proteiniphilum sp.]
MKNTRFILLFLIFNLTLSAQVQISRDSVLNQELIRTGLIHSPLTVDISNSFEANNWDKKILYQKSIYQDNNITGWKHHGLGKIDFSKDRTINGGQSMKMEFPTFTGKRAQGPPSDPDYATYGHISTTLPINGENWEKYNRIEFYIYPDCEGARVVNLNFSFENEDRSGEDGNNHASHLVNLVNRQWNRCFFELGEYNRDNVKSIGFSCSIKGKDRTTGAISTYYIDKIELQQIEDPDIVSGWTLAKNRIAYSTTGYMLNDKKTAIVNVQNKQSDKFDLIDSKTGEIVFSGKIENRKTTIGEFNILDFSVFNKPGYYQLRTGAIETKPFQIDDRIWDNSLWRVLNFIFCQRCGYPVPGKHGICHTDLCAVHNGMKISYGGGWHDAGDLSQQTLQTGDVTYSLLEAYNKLKDSNPLLAARILEEAEWGLEFILRTRFGDGYRASSVGLLIWLDGITNTLDDINTVRKQNLAFDNFLYAGYLAYAAMTVDRDPMLQEYLERIAIEDFEFAMQRHQNVGYGEFLYFYEHGYNTSESQYMATVSWAASMLYKLTNDQKYADLAAEYIQFTLSCQRKEPLDDNNKTKGFFYRDKSRKSIVHYIHQSREQIYMQAMTLLCKTQPGHPDYKSWEESIRLYGDYIKSLMKYTDPYGMLPSGVYNINEYQDSLSFYRLHLFPPENAEKLYQKQVRNGIQLDKEHYIRRFPVWFSIFNGNTAVHLSMGKAAAICGKFLKDETLLNIGREQMYWTVGKNPFGQSLIYGEGYNYPQMDSFSSGEIVGEIPVGIRSLDNEDIPYWPQTNNACYKEIWVTSAGKWISLAIEYDALSTN